MSRKELWRKSSVKTRAKMVVAWPNSLAASEEYGSIRAIDGAVLIRGNNMNKLEGMNLRARPALAALPMLFLACSADTAWEQTEPEIDGLVAEVQSAVREAGVVKYPGDRYAHYFSANGGKCVFQTTPGSLSDTVMWLYGPNSTTSSIACNDDN